MAIDTTRLAAASMLHRDHALKGVAFAPWFVQQVAPFSPFDPR